MSVVMNQHHAEKDLLNVFKREAMNIPLLTEEKESEIAQRAYSGDIAALQSLVEANIRLVFKIAHSHWKPGYSLADMVSEGCLGLALAAKRFNPDMGARFTSYAFPAIKHNVAGAMIDAARHVLESLNASAYEDGESLQDRISSEQCSPEEETETKELMRFLAVLTSRERHIIEQRYWGDKTLEEVGLSLGIQKERVRQIEAKALMKLRFALREMKKEWQ